MGGVRVEIIGAATTVIASVGRQIFALIKVFVLLQVNHLRRWDSQMVNDPENKIILVSPDIYGRMADCVNRLWNYQQGRPRTQRAGVQYISLPPELIQDIIDLFYDIAPPGQLPRDRTHRS